MIYYNYLLIIQEQLHRCRPRALHDKLPTFPDIRALLKFYYLRRYMRHLMYYVFGTSMTSTLWL